MPTVNIIGAGQVGQTLLRRLAKADAFTMGQVVSGSMQSAQAAVAAVGLGEAVGELSQMQEADIWLLSVPDDRIPDVAQALARAQAGQAPSIALHFSGYLSSDALAPLRGIGWATGSCHPVRSFADPAMAADAFDGTLCAVEGDDLAVQTARTLMLALGGKPFDVSAEHKAVYHAAAVVSNNFTTVLQALALDLWQAAGVEEATSQLLMTQLLNGTSENVGRLGPQAALTGPAARGDDQVMQAQEAALAALDPDSAALYRILSAKAVMLKGTGKTV